MKNTMNQNGISTTTQNGSEKFEYFESARQGRLCQYDYRTENGELFTCVGKSLDDCRKKRDEWLNKNEQIFDLHHSQ